MKMGNMITGTSEVSEAGLFWIEMTDGIETASNSFKVETLSPIFVSVGFPSPLAPAANFLTIYIDQDPALADSTPSLTLFNSGTFIFHTGSVGEKTLKENNKIQVWFVVTGSVSFTASYAPDKSRNR